MKIRKLIGTKKFYKRLIAMAFPIMIQNAITNFVGFLDNIMVGQLGTEQMSGVAIVNQYIFVFSLAIFGGLSGSGIFSAQFFGKGDHEGVRNTFRFKVWTGIVVTAIAYVLFVAFGTPLIQLFLTGDGAKKAETLAFGKEYLAVALFELIPFVVVQVYASTLREIGQTFIPMLAGIVAVFVNLTFNYILIFGHLGMPEMGVRGAAVATVLARIIEMLIVVIWTHRHKEKNLFIGGAYQTLLLPGTLAKDIFIMGFPLFMNEFLWAGGVAIINQCFSVRGLSVVAAINIASTINNLFNVVFISMGNCVAIFVGQELGAGRFEKAKTTAEQIICFSVVCTIFTGAAMFLFAGLFPSLYNTTGEVRDMAAGMLRIIGCIMPVQAFLHAVYFALRSGGRTVITFFFDSGFSWAVAIPFAYILTHCTELNFLTIYTFYVMLDLIKSTVGLILFQKKIWIRNIVGVKEG